MRITLGSLQICFPSCHPFERTQETGFILHHTSLLLLSPSPFSLLLPWFRPHHHSHGFGHCVSEILASSVGVGAGMGERGDKLPYKTNFLMSFLLMEEHNWLPAVYKTNPKLLRLFTPSSKCPFSLALSLTVLAAPTPEHPTVCSSHTLCMELPLSAHRFLLVWSVELLENNFELE